MEWRNKQPKISSESMQNLGKKLIKNCGKPLLSILTCRKTCKICMQDVFIFNMFKIDTCSHRYCSSCIKLYIEFKIRNESNVPVCPHENCHPKLNNIKRYKKFLSFKCMNLLEERVIEDLVQVADRFYCPYSDCSFLIPMPKNRSTSKIWCCSKCGRVFCIECRVPWHYEMSCDVYRRRNPGTANDVKLMVLAVQESWRQCPNCGQMIQLHSGCRFINCRCGRQLCYACGFSTSGDHICSCNKGR